MIKNYYVLFAIIIFTYSFRGCYKPHKYIEIDYANYKLNILSDNFIIDTILIELAYGNDTVVYWENPKKIKFNEINFNKNPKNINNINDTSMFYIGKKYFIHIMGTDPKLKIDTYYFFDFFIFDTTKIDTLISVGLM